ncbi:hypothetical protein ACXYMU_10030 [Pontibacter sp. CAU 1760]
MNILLAILLCSVLVSAIPVTARAAQSPNVTQHDAIDLTLENQLVLFAGEVSSGVPEAVLQLDKSLLAPVLHVLLQRLYPQGQRSVPAPHSYPASKGDCGLHTVLTKGP